MILIWVSSLGSLETWTQTAMVIYYLTLSAWFSVSRIAPAHNFTSLVSQQSL